MGKNNKGLADTHEGIILNESGTSVSIDPVEEVDIPETAIEKENDKNKKDAPKSQDQTDKL